MRLFLLYLFLFSLNIAHSQNVYTPEKGSNDRKEILDIFRKDFGNEKNQILFKVYHFKISGNWACAFVAPLKNNVEYGEPRWGLFNKVAGRWKEIKWSEGIEIRDDLEIIDLPVQNGRIAKLIVTKYPTCSMSIFAK